MARAGGNHLAFNRLAHQRQVTDQVKQLMPGRFIREPQLGVVEHPGMMLCYARFVEHPGYTVNLFLLNLTFQDHPAFSITALSVPCGTEAPARERRQRYGRLTSLKIPDIIRMHTGLRILEL
jgi:hypothetical protein